MPANYWVMVMFDLIDGNGLGTKPVNITGSFSKLFQINWFAVD